MSLADNLRIMSLPSSHPVPSCDSASELLQPLSSLVDTALAKFGYVKMDTMTPLLGSPVVHPFLPFASVGNIPTDVEAPCEHVNTICPLCPKCRETQESSPVMSLWQFCKCLLQVQFFFHSHSAILVAAETCLSPPPPPPPTPVKQAPPETPWKWACSILTCLGHSPQSMTSFQIIGMQ